MEKTKKRLKKEVKRMFPKASKEKLVELTERLFDVCKKYHKETLKEICR